MARFRTLNLVRRTALSAMLRYGLALVSVAAALGLSLILVHAGLPRLFGAFSCAAIAIAFWYGGTGPGILSVLLASAGFYFLLFPVTEVRGPVWQSFLAIYAIFLGFVGWFSGSRRRAERLLAEARDTEEKRMVERTRELARANQELQRTEEALRQSEDHLRRVIDTVPALIHTARPDGYLDFFNQRWLDFAGLSLSDLEGWKWTAAFHPEDVDATVKEWRASIATGEPFEHEGRVRRADGKYRWMLHRKVPLRDERGNIVKWYGSSIDIEDRKRAEEALRESEERYRNFISHSSEGVWRLELEPPLDVGLPVEESLAWLLQHGYIAECNDAFAQIVGFHHTEEVNGRLLRDLLPAADEERLDSFRSAARGGWQSRTIEFRGRDLAGNLKHVLRSEVPIVENGKLARMWGVTRDLTELKRAEEALRKSEERWRSVFENSAIGVALTDLDSRFLATNPVYQKMLGYSGEELRGLCCLDLTLGDHREPYHTLIAELIGGKRQQFQIEKQYRRKDGGLIWVRNSVSLVPGTENVPQFIMALSEDITERKKTEKALRRTEAYLEAGQRLSHTGSWALNLSSGELFWSEETYRVFGFDSASTTASMNGTFLPRIHPEDRPEVERRLKAAAIQKGTYSFDYRIVLPDGSTRYIYDVVYPVLGEAGDVVERYGVIMDVTERKQAEAALQRSRDQLRALAIRLQNVREEERTRVAREIHDELGQALTAIKIDLSSLSYGMLAERKREYESIMKLADETIQSVRRISTELRPAILDTSGLVAAVEWAAEEFEARTGTRCRLDLPQDEVFIDQDTATALFRIFQETLTNVARHAHATEVKVRLAKEDGDLTLEVHDNGVGAGDEQISAAASLGILGMRERALLLGGELTISGVAGKGTTVIARIPETRAALSRERQ